MSLEELEKRLRTLEDIEEIKQLQARYVDCLTTIDWDGLVDCFAENGFVDLSKGARGKEEIARFYKEEIAITHIGMEGNYVLHPVISIDGDKAKGSWLLYTMFSQPHKIQTGSMTIAEDAPDWMHGYSKWNISEKTENGKLVC